MRKYILPLALISILSCKKDKSETINSLNPICDSILSGGEIAVPTAFTPNGDGRNDMFRAILSDLSQEEFRLEVRRLDGTLAFSTTEKDGAWDGYIDGEKSSDYLFEVHIRFRDSGGNLIETCTYLYQLSSGANCTNFQSGDIPKYLFEDQINKATLNFEYNTGEKFCL